MVMLIESMIILMSTGDDCFDVGCKVFGPLFIVKEQSKCVKLKTLD